MYSVLNFNQVVFKFTFLILCKVLLLATYLLVLPDVIEVTL